MRDKYLLNMAYGIATSNCLTQEFDYDEFQQIECMDYAWEPFENWDESEYSSHIEALAHSILDALVSIRNKYEQTGI